MDIRVMTADDAQAYQTLRKEMLVAEPLAFGQDSETFAKKTVDEIRDQLTRKPNAGFTVGAWDGDELVGTVALYRPTEIKFCHGAFLVAMYVTKRVQGLGIGRRLVEALLEESKKKD